MSPRYGAICNITFFEKFFGKFKLIAALSFKGEVNTVTFQPLFRSVSPSSGIRGEE